MLMLSRRTKESVMIGNTVKVSVLKVDGDKVLLGFDAPKIVPIHREEIYVFQLSKKEKKGASDDKNN